MKYFAGATFDLFAGNFNRRRNNFKDLENSIEMSVLNAKNQYSLLTDY